MIKPVNINEESHTADFNCSVHGGSVTALSLNTNTSYGTNEEVVIIRGSELTDPCSCTTCFPTVNGNEDAQAIAAAKTE